MIQLKQIISILNEFNEIKILRADCHKEDIYNYNPAFYHEVYFGRIMDIPENIKDYFVISNSLSAEIDNENYPFLTIVTVKNI